MFKLRGVGAACLFGVLGCGGARPPAVAVPPPSRVEVLAPTVVTPLSAVPAPPELFAVGRISDPSKIADTSIGWSGLPLNWRSLLAKQVPGFDSVVALGAPIDFAAMLDPASHDEPRVFWAFAIGVASTDGAASFFRQQGWHVTSDASGAYHLQNGSSLACVAVPALGATAARVVCSDEAEGANALAPYMARGLPSESFGAAQVHVHVLAEPFRHRYGSELPLIRTVGVSFALRELSLDHPKFDRALSDVLYPLADELISLGSDLDRIDLDMTLTPQSDAVDTAVTIALNGQRSFWGQTMGRAAGQGGPAPDTFWKLPSDATAASYGAYSDPEHLRGPVVALRGLLEGWLDYEQLSEARRMALGQAFEDALTVSAKSAYASLPTDPATVVSPDPAAHFRDSLRASMGAHLFVLDQGGDRFQRLASEFVKSLGDRAFRERLVKTKVAGAEQLPTAHERAPKGMKGLPVGTKVFEFVIPATAITELDGLASAPLAKSNGAHKSAPAEKGAAPMSVVLIAAPDGPLTWFGFGTDEKALEARIVAVRAGTAPSLDRREGLAVLKSETALSAGFSSLGALGSELVAAGAMSNLSVLAQIPHHAETPMLWHVAADARGPRMTVTARVPKEVVEDAVALGALRLPQLAK